MLIPLCNFPHPLEQFRHAKNALCYRVNLRLSGAREIFRFPFNQGHEFFAEFDHWAIHRPHLGSLRVAKGKAVLL
jgi:hypothetical protein